MAKTLQERVRETIYPNGVGAITAEKEQALLVEFADVIDTKQTALVSGTNIKTINGQTILGNGNLEIEVEVDTTSLATKDELETLKNEVIDNEEVVAAALNDVRNYVDEQIANAITNALNTEV